MATGPAFAQRVGTPEWLDDVGTWVRASADAAGVIVRGEVRRERVRPWAALASVDSDAGRLWIKANAPAQRFEPGLQQLLSEVAPNVVDAPVAIDLQRGWMLTRDRGKPLGDEVPATVSDWRRVLVEAARLQRAVIDRRDGVVGLGVPDCSPATVVDRFDRLIDLLAGLPEDHPSHLPADLAADVRAARPRVVDAAAVLAENARLCTLQHGDLHPWNVFGVDGGLRLFDFGDAQWAHAFEVLRVPFAWVTDGFGLDWAPLLDAYLEVWDFDADEVDELLDAAAVCHPVNRALTWWRALESATAEELREWGDAPPFHLHGVTRLA